LDLLEVRKEKQNRKNSLQMSLMNSETSAVHSLSRLIWKFKWTYMERAFYSTSLFGKNKESRRTGKLVTSTLNPGRKSY